MLDTQVKSGYVEVEMKHVEAIAINHRKEVLP